MRELWEFCADADESEALQKKMAPGTSGGCRLPASGAQIADTPRKFCEQETGP